MGDPLATQPPTTMIMHRLRMAIIDKFGVHLQSIGLLEIIQPEPEYLTSRCIYFPNDDARAKLMVVEGEFIPDYPMDDAPQLMVSSFPIDMDDDQLIYRIDTDILLNADGKFINSFDSVVHLKQFNVFNKEFEIIGRTPTVYNFELASKENFNHEINWK